MEEKTRQALELVVEYANKLISSKLHRRMLEQGKISLRISLKEDEDVATIERDFIDLDEDVMNSFLIPFRIFILDKERCSFASLKKIAEDIQSGVSDVWRQGFNEVYDLYEQYLDQSAMLVLPDGSTPTRRKIMDIFLYGGKFHVDINKRQVFNKWKSMEWVFPFYELEFNHMLLSVLVMIARVSYLSEQELNTQDKSEHHC